MDEDVWFDGPTPGDGVERAFVDRVRELAPDGMGDRVSADDTGLFPYGCLVIVDVPGVPANEVPVYTHQLQVLFAPGLLGGYWGCSHLWDGFDPADLEALYVTGDVTPQEAAEAAVRWMAHQLHRPLVVQEWDNRLSGTKTRRWVLADTGRLVAGKRRVPQRRPVPSRVVSLWPTGAEARLGEGLCARWVEPAWVFHLVTSCRPRTSSVEAGVRGFKGAVSRPCWCSPGACSGSDPRS